MFDAFLSHSHKEKAFIEEIADKLEAHGISVWLDKRQIIPGDSFIDSIEKGMSLCHTCLIFYGKNTPNGWFKNEIESALIRIAYDKTFRVIPVLLPRANETNVNNFVKALHWVKFTKKNDDEAFFTLLKGIRRESPGKYISRDSLSI
ncbi:MAG: toll/interleukin-1 receptor domain-containing protein [Bacteroidetes bacterium]|nr:toll/interleukin-1 receptor domain-containing protein [Bacteroidota bacterium]